MALVSAAIASNDGFSASDIELEREGVSYTVDTLRELRQRHPGADLFWIVGGDSLAGFETTWHEPREILRLAWLAAYPRPGADLSSVPGWVMARTTLVDAPLFDVSSTDLRRRLAAGASVRYLIPDPVLDVIRERGLYRTDGASGV